MVKTVITKGIQGPAGPPGPPGPTDNAGPGLIVNSAGNIAANFGTETGTVADGGALAATTAAAAQAQATAAGAVPSASPVITAPLSNPAIIAESYEIPANSNAVNFGPITIAPDVSITVPESSTYRIY